ncbi:MAG: hypothetical protein JW395_3608 [Nitrospira sp.]|nr:hypothetical protein [Nitrospira sp.]
MSYLLIHSETLISSEAVAVLSALRNAESMTCTGPPLAVMSIARSPALPEAPPLSAVIVAEPRTKPA